MENRNLLEIRDLEIQYVKDDETGVATVVAPSELEKCERCWIHRDTVGQDSAHPTLCARCADVVKTL